MTAIGDNLDAQVDPRFGRCQYFMIVDSETLEFEVVPNTAVGLASGAGIRAAQAVVSKGAKVVITGNVGPKAFQALSAAGINVVTDVSVTVREAMERYKKGELKEMNTPTVRGHFRASRGS